MNEIKYIEFFTVILSDGSENAPIIFVHDRMNEKLSIKIKSIFLGQNNLEKVNMISLLKLSCLCQNASEIRLFFRLIFIDIMAIIAVYGIIFTLNLFFLTSFPMSDYNE